MSFQIKSYTPPQLLELINSEEFKHYKDYPITKHRALSHINNPRVNSTDKILYIAFENSEVIAYRLIMADSITINNNTEKIGWYSCVWVHPNKRGSGIAKELVKISLADWNNNIIFQGPVSASKNLYTSTNIFNEVFIEGLRAYSRFDINHVISAKKPSLKPFSFLFKVTDSFLNFFIDAFKHQKKCPDNIQLVNEIDTEVSTFIKERQANNLFKRGQDEINWILKYPWIINADTIDHISANYYFSSLAKDFQFINAKFCNDNDQLEGFVMLQLRDNHLSVYNAYYNNNQTKNIVDFIYHVIHKNKANSFSIYDSLLINIIVSNPNPFLFKKNLKRGFYYSKNFQHYFKENPQLSFDAGDGDMIFT